MSIDNGLVGQIGSAVADLPKIDQLKMLISLRFDSVSRWAVVNQFLPEQVFMTLSGAREYPQIKERLAADLGMSADEVSEIIAAAAESKKLETS